MSIPETFFTTKRKIIISGGARYCQTTDRFWIYEGPGGNRNTREQEGGQREPLSE